MRSLVLLACLTATASAEPLTGRWLVSAESFGAPNYFVMNLTEKGGALTGDFDTDPLTGTVSGTTVKIAAVDPKGGHEEAALELKDGELRGTLDILFTGSKDVQHMPFVATRFVEHTGAPQRHEFTPTAFQREFSAKNPPVLHIGPRDTVHTWTVDAGGVDAKGVQRSRGGNPQTGPFYVDGAMPGDTLAVHVVKLQLNRDYAISTNGIVPRGLDSDTAGKYADGKVDQVRWKLDRAKGVATLEKPGEHLKNYSVPVRPMLGCVATATWIGGAAPPTGDSGDFGGNMDFNEIREGATVYLPVANPGALLYVGDAHARQGDGETTGDALETSMDVTFSVELIPKHRLPGPRVENATHIIALGYAGSVDDAVRDATANMGQWLTERYGLTPPEIAEVFGTAAEYRITELADRNAGIALSIDRSYLRTLPSKPSGTSISTKP